MDESSLRLVLRYGLAAFYGLGALAVLWSLLARPDVAQLVDQCIEAAAVVLCLAGAALAIGFVNHKLQLWRAQRPPELRPAMIEALTHAAGPTLATQQEAVNLVFEAERAEVAEDEVERWKSAVVRFCLLGNVRGFAWVDLAGLVDRDSQERPGWDTLVHLLDDAGVLELGAGSRKTQWAPGWCYTRLKVELKFDILSLPYPAGAPAPVVRWVRGYSMPRMQTKHTKHAKSKALATLPGAYAGESEGQE